MSIVMRQFPLAARYIKIDVLKEARGKPPPLKRYFCNGTEAVDKFVADVADIIKAIKGC